jgi:hypothetical protein
VVLSADNTHQIVAEKLRLYHAELEKNEKGKNN